MTADQWDQITGQSGGLTAGSEYFMDPAAEGRMTTSPRPAPGNWTAAMGMALSREVLSLSSARDASISTATSYQPNHPSGTNTNSGRRRAKIDREMERTPYRRTPLSTLAAWMSEHGHRIDDAPPLLLEEAFIECEKRAIRLSHRRSNARTRAQSSWLGRWCALINREIQAAESRPG